MSSAQWIAITAIRTPPMPIAMNVTTIGICAAGETWLPTLKAKGMP